MINSEGLNYLKRIRLEQELDGLVIKDLKLTLASDGEFCKKCDIVQGEALNGFKKFYCEHLTNKIDRLLLPEKKEITEKIMLSLKHSNGHVVVNEN